MARNVWKAKLLVMRFGKIFKSTSWDVTTRGTRVEDVGKKGIFNPFAVH